MDIGRAIKWRRASMWWGTMILGMVIGDQAMGAEKPHDLVLFASIEAFDLFDSSYPELEEYETRYTADVLYTYSGSRFRALAEFIASSHENEMERLSAEDIRVERSMMSRSEAVAMFQAMGEEYKVEIIESIPTEEGLSFYRQGDFIDLCRGPHVPSTGHIKAFKLMSVAIFFIACFPPA